MQQSMRMIGGMLFLRLEKTIILWLLPLLTIEESQLVFYLGDKILTPKHIHFNVTIDEIDVCPVQIQGPKSVDLMADLVGDAVRDIPYYGLMEAKVGGRDCIISQTGFTGEKGYEIYLKDATKYADDMWNAGLEAGKKHNLMVMAGAHHRRIQAGIISWGQDMDNQNNPFQCNLG